MNEWDCWEVEWRKEWWSGRMMRYMVEYEENGKEIEVKWGISGMNSVWRYRMDDELFEWINGREYEMEMREIGVGMGW